MKNIITIPATDQNASPLLKEALTKLSPEQENLILFEKGTYRFEAEGSDQYPIFASSSDFCVGAPKTVTFPLIDVKNLTLDGAGSEFVFCDRVQPFYLRDCENITLKNFSVDYSFLRYAFAVVTAADEEGFTIRLDSSLFSYSVAGGDILFHCGKQALSTKDRKISSKGISRSCGVFFLYSENATHVVRNLAAPNVTFYAEALSDDLIRIRYTNADEKTAFLPGDEICLAYDNDREAQTFSCEFSKQIAVENVTIYRQGGMGFVADACEDIRLEHFTICLKPGRKEYFSTTADGIFLTNCRGNFLLKDSSVTDTYDDAMNIHGYYMYLKEILPDGRIVLTHDLHPSHLGVVALQTGDRLIFSDPQSMDEVCTATVTDFTYDRDNRKEILVTPDTLCPLYKGMIVENRDSMPNVVIENNTFRNCPHIRLSAPKALVRHNTFALNYTDLYINDLFAYWAECGAVEEILIQENSFSGVAPHNIEILSCRPETANRQHGKITIQQNTFQKDRDTAISVTSPVSELLITDNQFE